MTLTQHLNHVNHLKSAARALNRSTRATVHFVQDGQTRAIVYRHSDGYPEGLGADLNRFFDEVRAQTQDTRFTDPEYLAAKFVVWQAGQYAYDPDKPLDFLSVGVVIRDPRDIEYRYVVFCDGGTPIVKVQEVSQ